MASKENFQFPCCVEYAKSNRSQCKNCYYKIDKGVVRIGQQYDRDHSGYYWYHVKCFNNFPRDGSTTAADFLFGFENLSAADQAKVTQALEGPRATGKKQASVSHTTKDKTPHESLARQPFPQLPQAKRPLSVVSPNIPVSSPAAPAITKPTSSSLAGGSSSISSLISNPFTFQSVMPAATAISSIENAVVFNPPLGSSLSTLSAQSPSSSLVGSGSDEDPYGIPAAKSSSSSSIYDIPSSTSNRSSYNPYDIYSPAMPQQQSASIYDIPTTNVAYTLSTSYSIPDSSSSSFAQTLSPPAASSSSFSSSSSSSDFGGGDENSVLLAQLWGCTTVCDLPPNAQAPVRAALEAYRIDSDKDDLADTLRRIHRRYHAVGSGNRLRSQFCF